AFRSLNTVLSRNNVKRQYRQQMFFERATDKRVRLRSQRHRKRFREAVQELILTVKDMKKRGY
ncbi:hypothetical protein SAICODRAFT_48158, partial [Saitoella complicata NRRL Y-17804]|uniref:uncharacterized protein n=1 Tax=Saitoella complicata (strain BCRC 22490 / CBS 7301 / JCM 7358 / NBRC 10748 / NRRL Y-17804) TaxID=698492 RepID=UPI000866CE48